MVHASVSASESAFMTRSDPHRNCLYWLLGLALLACSDRDRARPLERTLPDASVVPSVDLCATPREGCECAEPLEAVDCGQVKEQHGSYATCSAGTRTCTEDGTWGPCVGERITLKATQSSSPGLRPLALGTPEVCPPGFDPCDPYCNVTTDTPAGIMVPDGFNQVPEGLTLIETGVANCTELELEASTDALTVTQFSPLTIAPAGAVTFTLTASPPGCASPPFPATWTVDKPDRAVVAGTSDGDATLTLAVPLGGPLRITAYAVGLSASTEVEVKVNVLEARGSVSPNSQTSSAARYTAFGAWNSPAAGSGSVGVNWLYPYADTYFPLGLPAPVVQYWYTNTGGSETSSALSDRDVKVSLRYPVNTSSNPGAGNYSDFNYSIIVRESNVVSQSAGQSQDSRNPQVVIPDAAWRYFERTARGNFADLLIQRRRGTTLEPESRRRIYFVDGQLKGTVYYNSYSSPQGGDTGAILAIEPGASSPRLAVQPSGRCTVCHSVNLQGTSLITNGYRPDGNNWFNQSRRYNITNTASFPSPPVQQSYTHSSDADGNVPGNRYTFGAPWGDGTLYMTHGGCSPGASNGTCSNSTDGERNWRAPRQFSRLFRVTDATNPLSVTNWPTNVLAVTPRFSPDGTKLAFGFWGGSNISSLSAVTGGTRLAVVNFTCSSPPCTSSSTGWSVSNARDLTPSVASGTNSTAGTLKVAWPSFTPAGDAVVYQRQYRTSRSGSGSGGVLANGWSPSDVNTVSGALAELWISNVPNSGNGTPTRLLALNGLNSSGTPYLPEDDRTFGPFSTLYHQNTGASFLIRQADYCSNTGTATNVYDHRLNYLPSVAPIEAGDYSWVVFTSRRMYGSVARDTPWEAKANVSCYSGNPNTKKLWVAAINRNWTPGTDPSHPAFYLPGQELTAGNSNGYWVNTPCAAVGASCVTNDDCCNGTGADAVTQCKVVSTATFPPVRQCENRSSCSVAGEECSVTADCCTGLSCPDGGGLCLQIPNLLFEQQTLQREYVAECPEDTLVEWRFLEWQATIPNGTSLEFAIQTKEDSADDYDPGSPLFLSQASSTTPANVWHRGPSTVHDVLREAEPQLTSRKHLLLTIFFNPDTNGSVAPTLRTWRQLFDCVPGE